MKYQKGSISIVVITILVLVIIAVGFMYFKNNKSAPLTNTEKLTGATIDVSKESGVQEVQTVNNKATSSVNEAPALGIVVTSLKNNDLVKFPITIEGYLDGNGWYANEGEIGVVEVFDSNGKSISSREIIKTTTDWKKFPTYFKAMVGDREMMSYIQTNDGMVKITANGAKDGESLRSITIPVRFK